MVTFMQHFASAVGAWVVLGVCIQIKYTSVWS